MAALSCLSISGAWRHTSDQLGHQKQWACCLIQTQARRQCDALQDPSESPDTTHSCPIKQKQRVNKAAHLNTSLRSSKASFKHTMMNNPTARRGYVCCVCVMCSDGHKCNVENKYTSNTVEPLFFAAGLLFKLIHIFLMQ